MFDLKFRGLVIIVHLLNMYAHDKDAFLDFSFGSVYRVIMNEMLVYREKA